MKTVMFAAPHGSGKSETCEKIISVLPQFMYMPSIAGNLAKELGYDLNDNPSPDDRISYQKKLLTSFKLFTLATEYIDVLYDRSPFDFAAYFHLGLQHNWEKYGKLIEHYTEECIRHTRLMCDVLIVPTVDVNQPYEDKDRRPKFTPAEIYARKTYYKLLDIYLEELARPISYGKNTKVIIVPEEYQYQDRVDYILSELKPVL